MKKAILTAMLIAVVGLGVSAAQAQGPGGGPPNGRPGDQGGPGGQGGPGQQMGLLDAILRLDLSEEQREEIRNVLDTFRPQVEQLRETLMELDAEFRETLREVGYNEALLGPIAEAKGDGIAEEMLLRAQVEAAIIGVLTAEQLEVLEGMGPGQDGPGDGGPGNNDGQGAPPRRGAKRGGPSN